MLIKCAEELSGSVDIFKLFLEFRSDQTTKAIIQRAKSILAADQEFFSATSPHQRIRGNELHERLARRFVEDLLTSEPGQILMLHDAYTTFCSMLKQHELAPLKRSDFKAMVVPMIRDEFNVALRNDLVVDERSGVRGWKNVKMISDRAKVI